MAILLSARSVLRIVVVIAEMTASPPAWTSSVGMTILLSARPVLQIVGVTAEMTASPPAWASSVWIVSPPADFLLH